MSAEEKSFGFDTIQNITKGELNVSIDGGGVVGGGFSGFDGVDDFVESYDGRFD